VECRPLIAGNIYRQPFFYEKFGNPLFEYPFADRIHDHGIYLPNNADITKEDIHLTCSIINSITTNHKQ
jgi:CDP-6-deoxy-D-xylo-4-hexulose-3-dehydrase